MSDRPCKYCGHWPDPADGFAYVAVCNGETFCGEPVCHGKCYQCRIAELEGKLAEAQAENEALREIDRLAGEVVRQYGVVYPRHKSGKAALDALRKAREGKE